MQDVAGVLEIDGRPGGAIYLDSGHITFAWASWSPNLAARLSSVLPPISEVRDLLAVADQPECDLSAQLIAGGYLSASQLHAILRLVIIDAVMVLTAPSTDQASVAGIRFEPGRRHWAESFCRLPAHQVRAEAARQAERITRHDLANADAAGQIAGLAGASRRIPRPPGRSAVPKTPARRQPAAVLAENAGSGDASFAQLPPAALVRVLDGLRKLN